jgi:hypothetical protein
LFEERRSASGSPWLALAVWSAILLLVLWRGQPPAPRPVSASAAEFSAERARAVLARILGDSSPHPVGSAAGAAVRERIVAELRAVGLEPEIQEAFACAPHATCATVRNVLARLPGRETGRMVLLSAHYDSVAAGPGASDDGAGVAAVLEIARALKSQGPLRRPVLLILDDGEEAGLLGAEAFAGHPFARDLGAAVNVDGRGTSGPSYLIETGPGNRQVARLAASALARPAASSLYYEIYKRMPNDTDFTVWKRLGVQGTNFAFSGEVTRYHTVRDDLAHVDLRSLQHQGENALAMVRAFGELDLKAPPPGDAVFFDVLGWILLQWPAGWSLELSAFALLLVAAASIRLLRVGALSVAQWGWGLLTWIAAIAAAGAGAFGLVHALRAAGGLPRPWIATPWPLLTAVGLTGLAATLAAGAWLGRRAGEAGVWAGAWLPWCALGLIAAWQVPGASYLFLAPAVVAGLVALAPRSRGRPSRTTSFIPAAVAGLLWLPPLSRSYDTLGWRILPAVAALLALVLATAAPSWAAVTPRRFLLPAAAALAALVLAGLSLAVPRATRERPERLNLDYFLDASAGRASWLASPESGALPPSLSAAAPFQKRPHPLPWGDPNFQATAPRLELPGPTLELVESSADTRGVRLRVRMRSHRGAPVTRMAIPAAGLVEVLHVQGQGLPPAKPPTRIVEGGWRFVSVLTTPPEGVEVELLLAPGPAEIQVLDRSNGLPDAAAALRAARPEWCSPTASGDVVVVRGRTMRRAAR